MIFSSQAQSLLKRLFAAVSLVLLASCGGGTTQVESFVPERYFAFGDEASFLDTSGRKFAVNAISADGRLNCEEQPIWVQQIAGGYGFVFAECNPSAVSDLRARMMARPGARADDIGAQIDAQLAAGGFRDKDLATLLTGANDILELYAQFPARSEASLLADARARGVRLGQAVNRLVGLGVKVVISTVPDMGLTPFGKAERLAFQDIDRSAFLTQLTAAFNQQLGVTVLLDGRFVGLVQGDLQFQAIDRSPPSFGVTNVNTPLCTVALPQCTTSTLIANADLNGSLWADATRFAAVAHTQLASLALSRARNNPF